MLVVYKKYQFRLWIAMALFLLTACDKSSGNEYIDNLVAAYEETMDHYRGAKSQVELDYWNHKMERQIPKLQQQFDNGTSLWKEEFSKEVFYLQRRAEVAKECSEWLYRKRRVEMAS